MKGAPVYKGLIFLLLLLAAGESFAQLPRNMRGLPNLRGGGGGQDSLQRRDKFEDSITINYRFIDSARNYRIDSSIAHYTTRFPIPAH
ncbi:MAG: hypothetical protein ACO1NX_10645, partial [Chitinophagaceae bacterium]